VANQLPDLNGQSVNQTVNSFKQQGIETVVLGKGSKITAQLPKSGSTIIEGEKVIIQTDGDITVPDMTGWSLRDVMKVAKLTGLKLTTSGNGYVVNQNMKSGAPIHKGDSLTVDLVTPEEQLKNGAATNPDTTGNDSSGKQNGGNQGDKTQN
jgi:penicillin-binding protein 2B